MQMTVSLTGVRPTRNEFEPMRQGADLTTIGALNTGLAGRKIAPSWLWFSARALDTALNVSFLEHFSFSVMWAAVKYSAAFALKFKFCRVP